jgi:hypothetical protein
MMTASTQFACFTGTEVKNTDNEYLPHDDVALIVAEQGALAVCDESSVFVLLY